MRLAEYLRVPVARQLAAGATRRKYLGDQIASDILKHYNEEAAKFARELGAPRKFRLDARWKHNEINRTGRAMGDSLHRTFAKERLRIDALPISKRERDRKFRRFVTYKKKQLRGLIEGEAKFTAQTDILAQSGFIDPDKSRVMNFMNLGPDTCPICEDIAMGNPYTVRAATTLGAKAHPNCACEWAQDWGIDRALLRNIKRQVRDGEAQVWTGKGRTPARAKAQSIADKMQIRKGGWKGRRTEQRRRATERARA